MYNMTWFTIMCATHHTVHILNRPRPADIVTNKENPTQNTFLPFFWLPFFEEKQTNLDFKGLKRLLFCV